MGSQQSDDRHFSVVLGLFDTSYTAEIWNESADDWFLLSVRLKSGESEAVQMTSFATLEAALFAAERVAKTLIVG
ncbi:hypothetical protein LQE85_11885 [Stenotrophomonas rhizophila]|uniref:hypothetical protein n=1 Tax=Stenotrophomonas rhizophila TaxID=216778 RepID=UPI00201CD5EC|nr:hypothetical protein [Stenotrophomonas rhizophila]UQY86204.1 hypothetical protein LQE85_11885 [Stenotrophomonas rhizophila]